MDEDLLRIQEAIDLALSEAAPDMSIVTSWVMMVELSHADGDAQLIKIGAEGAPQWRADGMLFHGLHGGAWEVDAEDD